MKVLAIAGSLRAASINAAFCRAAARLAPADLQISVFAGLGGLPLFNPDNDAMPPGTVVEFRAAVARSDALLIASPEYAHGVSGVMKNALDWLVSFEGFVCKPVAVVNTSPRAHLAYDALVETLRTMSATIVPDASIAIQLLGAGVTEDGILRSPELSAQVRYALSALHSFLTR
jgi:NAD(P)H-dependent FMN reductase